MTSTIAKDLLLLRLLRRLLGGLLLGSQWNPPLRRGVRTATCRTIACSISPNPIMSIVKIVLVFLDISKHSLTLQELSALSTNWRKPVPAPLSKS